MAQRQGNHTQGRGRQLRDRDRAWRSNRTTQWPVWETTEPDLPRVVAAKKSWQATAKQRRKRLE